MNEERAKPLKSRSTTMLEAVPSEKPQPFWLDWELQKGHLDPTASVKALKASSREGAHPAAP